MKHPKPGRSACLPLLFTLSLTCVFAVPATINAQVADGSAGVFQWEHPRPAVSLGSDPWVQFVKTSVNRYAISTDGMDQGSAIVPLYTNYNAGGTYGLPDAITNITVDDNDPDVPPGGISSYRMTWDGVTGSNGYFQFDIGCPADGNGPRDIPNFGMAHKVWFYAKGDATNRMLKVLLFQRASCSGAFVASQWFSLSTGWAEYSLNVPANLRPQDLHAVQFLMDLADDPGGGTVRLTDVRIDTDGYDPLRGIQSYIPHWGDPNAPMNTPSWRDAHLYPNRSYLYDNALAIRALLLGGDTTDAMNIADGRLATDCTTGFYNELNSGHTLLANSMPRGPLSLRRRLGDNAWFGLALLQLYQATGNSTYLTCARQLSDWAEIALKDTTGTLQGYMAGYDDTGAALPSRSTEENSDFFELNQQLAGFFGATYAARATWAGNFVINMYDSQGQRFWAGTSSMDTINMGSIPLDAQTLPLLTLGMSQQYQGAVNYTAALRWAEANLTVTDTTSSLTGFTYSTQSAMQSPPRVWLEGVAQGCVAYELLGRLEPNSSDLWGAKVQQCLQTLEDASMNGTGVLAASSDDLEDTVLNQFYDARQAEAPTAWAVVVRSLLALK